MNMAQRILLGRDVHKELQSLIKLNDYEIIPVFIGIEISVLLIFLQYIYIL